MSGTGGRRGHGVAWLRFQLNLRNAIARREITHDQVAARMERSTRWVRRILSGETAPHIDDIVDLARICKITPEELAFGTIAPPPPPVALPILDYIRKEGRNERRRR